MANTNALENKEVRQNVDYIMDKGKTPVEVAEFYNKWADGNVYEKQLFGEVYTGPAVLAREAAKGLTPEQRSKARVLDVAAGTGLCALQMKNYGFQHLDALDPAQGMLDKARERNLYERYICDFITEKPLDIAENTYDLLTICGGLGEGHIPHQALYEMVRLVKPGGRIVIVTRESHRYQTEDYIGRLEPLMDQLEKDGKWKKVACEIFPNYVNGMDGLIWVFQIC